MADRTSSRPASDEGVHPLCAVDVADPASLMHAVRETLSGGDALLAFSAQSAASAHALCAEHPTVPRHIALVVRTSGSTGTPKAISLSRAALLASAEATHEALGGPGQWLVALSPEVIAGAQMLIRSIVANEEPIFCIGHFSAERFIAAAATLTAPRRYTSLVPVQLARLLDLLESREGQAVDARTVLARFDAILVGGQALNPNLAAQARAAGLKIVRTYGSTETASGCVYDGKPIGNTQVRVVEGEIWIAGSTLADGYLDDAKLTSDRFVISDGQRWFRTRDRGSFTDGTLSVTGRIGNVIISGGVNVALDELQRFVSEQTGWQSAVVVPVEDTQWGQRPGVCVVGSAPDFDELRNQVRNAYGPAWVPVAVREVSQLPLLASGKPDRLTLQKLF